jgi:hypothetical protein
VRLYAINRQSGAATAVGPSVTVSQPGGLWGMSFSATVDRVRIVNDHNANARLNPDTGSLAGSDVDLTSSAVVDSIAYTNQFPGATTTTLYALNFKTHRLARIGGPDGVPSPNGGVVTDIGPPGLFGPGSTALDFDATGTLYASMGRGTSDGHDLYRIDVGTGAATYIGPVGGSLQIDSIAAPPAVLAISPPSGTYTSRQSFDLVLLLNARGRSIVDGSAQFNSLNALPYLASCVVFGTVSTNGMVSLRCPNFGGPLVGPGVHTMTVNLLLSNGETVSGSATWTILATSEP